MNLTPKDLLFSNAESTFQSNRQFSQKSHAHWPLNSKPLANCTQFSVTSLKWA